MIFSWPTLHALPQMSHSKCFFSLASSPLRRSSPPKFSIGGVSADISAAIRPLLVEKREPPCGCSNSLKYRSVPSSGSLRLIMKMILIFSSYLPLIIQVKDVNLTSFLSVSIHEVSFWPPTLIVHAKSLAGNQLMKCGMLRACA